MRKNNAWVSGSTAIILGLAVLIVQQAHATVIGLGIVAHPQSTTVEIGKSVTLAAAFKGPIKEIQWKLNGQPIPEANQATLSITVTETKLRPDEYEVVVQDAFGQTIVSRKASVTGLPPTAEKLREEARRVESIKLQELFRLVNIFDQVGEQITGPLSDRNLNSANAASYYSDCPGHAKFELLGLAQTNTVRHQALKMEATNCYLSKTNSTGEEAGLLVNGILIQSRKSEIHENRENIVNEKFARNLSVRFPGAKNMQADAPVDLDIELNGKVIHSVETIRSAGKAAKINEEYTWTSNTHIENTQTGVRAALVSGRIVREMFGEFQGGSFYPSRESETFKKVRLKVGPDEVLIDGSITRLVTEDTVRRLGQVSISINGKEILVTNSTAYPPAGFQSQLPFIPKLNGFFINDHAPGSSIKKQ
jgi:hypothetical protein